MKKKKKEKNPIREVSVFGIGFGLLMGYVAYSAFTGIKDAPDLWGMKRSIAIGSPAAIISVAFLFSGISLIVTKAKWAVISSILSAFIAAGLYFLFEVSTMGLLQGKLISLIYWGGKKSKPWTTC